MAVHMRVAVLRQATLWLSVTGTEMVNNQGFHLPAF